MKPSGGTLSTLLNSLENPLPRNKDGDPLLKLSGKSEKSKNTMRANLQKYLGFHAKSKKWVGKWMLSEGNAGIVKRSNALINYNEKLMYFEGLAYRNFFHGFND